MAISHHLNQVVFFEKAGWWTVRPQVYVFGEEDDRRFVPVSAEIVSPEVSALTDPFRPLFWVPGVGIIHKARLPPIAELARRRFSGVTGDLRDCETL